MLGVAKDVSRGRNLMGSIGDRERPAANRPHAAGRGKTGR